MKPSRLWAVSTREAQACTIHDRTNRDSATRKHTEEERKGEGDEEAERNDNFIKANKQRKKWATEKVNRMKTRDLLYLSYTFLSFYI